MNIYTSSISLAGMFDAACGNNPALSGGVGGKVTAGTQVRL